MYACAFFTIPIAMGDMESQCEKANPKRLGQLCLTPSQIPALFYSGVGQWKVLLGKSLMHWFYKFVVSWI